MIQSSDGRGIELVKYQAMRERRLHPWDFLANHLEIGMIYYLLKLSDGRMFEILKEDYDLLLSHAEREDEKAIFDFAFDSIPQIRKEIDTRTWQMLTESN